MIIFNNKYRNHNFIAGVSSGYVQTYCCSECSMNAGHDFLFRNPTYFWIYFDDEGFDITIFSVENLLNCEEVQIKKLLE